MKYVVFLISVLIFSNVQAQDIPSNLDSTSKASVDSAAFYGLVPVMPVKVDGGFTNGVSNQKGYLNALRDAQGESISFKRLGSCFAYTSSNGFDGSALLDQYQINYRDQDGKKQKTVVYISLYDYERLKPLRALLWKIWSFSSSITHVDH